MYLNGYTARIEGGDEKAEGYIYMRQSQPYSIILLNDKSTRCNAQVSIDGKDIGTWRLESYAATTIKRPANEDGQLTFYKTASVEGRLTNNGISQENEGLIVVRFTPERIEPEVVLMEKTISVSYDVLRSNKESGHTGLAEKTGQRFGIASEMRLDNNKTITISLRLVARIPIPVVPQQVATIPKPPGPPYGSYYIRPIQQTVVPRPV